MDKLINYYSLCDIETLKDIFTKIRIKKNIILFGNLSYYGMSFLTKLHVKLTKIKNWEIDLTWLIFLSNFLSTNIDLVILKNKKQIECNNKKTAKKYVIKNIYINPGLFFRYHKICNDKKILKKIFNKNVFKTLHTYTTNQALFAIEKFTMESIENIKIMLQLDNFNIQKFIFNKTIISMTTLLQELNKYIELNTKIKINNRMYWITQLKLLIEKSKIKIIFNDIKSIKFKQFDEISDFLVEEVTMEILNSDELKNQNALPYWTNKIFEYLKKNIENDINKYHLYNHLKYSIYFNFPIALKILFRNLLRVQLTMYDINSKYFKNAMNIILRLQKIDFYFFKNDNSLLDDPLWKFINKKFNLYKEIDYNNSFFHDYKDEWFNLTLLNSEDSIKEEKIKWEKSKK
ncbi:hypothetical protein [Spiroplasma endosymbiont of Polydrusus pterygomalis]|uniref:hypothetical protein n=1 Tax=Spiroplasma endosymbiont of Polydrusus pterygomalis TaxID=3139327 RepID=UPI003CCAA552